MLISASLLLAGAAMPLPLAAQAMVQPLPGTTDADKLADLVRELGRNPRDLSALIEAGDLSAKLGDTTAAAALYKRASQIDPNNARVKAGIARILVNGEHPGEALRYFDQAQRSGLSPTMFADDRGLAYDLIGEQERAQRDYRLALARPGQDNEDEVRRRYALSLGISGRKDEALQQIDALLRKSDRGAWRARAFILAMNGDANGANHIATTMMPAGMAGGLAAFFTRLPTLSPADRAFAVHFGEVAPTPERLADARLVPVLPALAPDPYARTAPVQVAAQTAAPSQTRDRRRGRESRQVAQQAAAGYASPATQRPTFSAFATQPSPAPTQVARAAPPGGYVRQPVPSGATTAAANVPSAAMPTQPAAPAALATTRPVTPTAVTSQPSIAATLAAASGTRAVVPSTAVTPSSNAVTLAAAAETRTVVPSASGTPTIAAASPVTNSAANANNLVRAQGTNATGTVQVAAASVPAAVAPTTPASQPVLVAATQPAAIGQATSAPAPQGTLQPTQVAAATPAVPPRAESEDSILARIVANISIPASELGVAPMPNAAPQPGTTTLDEAAVAAERNAAALQRRREVAASERPAAPIHARRTPVQTETASTDGSAETPAATPRRRTRAKSLETEDAATTPTRRTGRAAAKQLADVEASVVETPAATRRSARTGKKVGDTQSAAADAKKLPVKTKADTKTLVDRKAAADEKKAARADPERYWIQVAGGATEGDLKKAWASTQAKSKLLAGRAGYSTPLRVTNRVVTGPFKTQAEAQAMGNKLSKQGVSAFTFTSETGQKMTKLDGK